MERLKKIFTRVLHPGAVPAALLSLLCTAALIYIFVSGQEETVPAYITYAFSTYTLTVLSLSFINIFARVRAVILNNRYINRYLNDVSFRVKFSLYTSFIFNLIYAAVKLTAGIYYASFWYGADAVFYIILSAARFLLLRQVRNDGQDYAERLKKYRFCGILILALNLVFIAVIYQIVYYGLGFKYPGILIYVVSVYTFYCIITGVINAIKFRKFNNPIYSAQKAISLVKALVAVFALQTAMFASFSESVELERIMNIVTGIIICGCIFTIALIMVFHANKQLKK